MNPIPLIPKHGGYRKRRSFQISQVVYDELRQTLEKLSEESLMDKLHYDIRVIDLAGSTVRHDAWHAGQIAVARRLYRMCERP